MTNSAILYVFNLSVTPAACHLPYRGEALAYRKTFPLRQRLPSVGELSAKQTERLFSFLRAVLNAHVQTQLFQRMERLFGIGGVLCGGAGLVGADRHRDA